MMILFRILLLISFIVSIAFFNICKACECVYTPLTTLVNNSAFIAKIKILKVSEATADGEYQTAEIEVLDLYKGKQSKTIKINAALKTDCILNVKENSTWLVFADYGKSGKLEFGYCSGSIQIDQQIDTLKYPDLKEKLKRSIELKTSVLNFFKENKINKTNEDHFTLNVSDFMDKLIGYPVSENRFAVYQLIIEKDLTISKVKMLQSFGNKDLSEKIAENLLKLGKIHSKQVQKLDKPSIMTIVFYHYPSEQHNGSFISRHDL